MITIDYPIDLYTFQLAKLFKTKKMRCNISFYWKRDLRKDIIYLKV